MAVLFFEDTVSRCIRVIVGCVSVVVVSRCIRVLAVCAPALFFEDLGVFVLLQFVRQFYSLKILIVCVFVLLQFVHQFYSLKILLVDVSMLLQFVSQFFLQPGSSRGRGSSDMLNSFGPACPAAGPGKERERSSSSSSSSSTTTTTTVMLDTLFATSKGKGKRGRHSSMTVYNSLKQYMYTNTNVVACRLFVNCLQATTFVLVYMYYSRLS